MANFFKKRKLNIIYGLAAVILMWLVWIIAYYAVGNEYIVPSFSDTVKSFFACLGQKTFWVAFGYTFLRSVIAFAISFFLAALCASLAAASKRFSAFLQPVMVLLRTLPTMAVILIILIWTSPKWAPVIVTVLVLFPMIYSQFCAAFGGIDDGLKNMARVYNLSKKQRIGKIYLPLVMPSVLSEVGANVSLCLKLVISAEVLANTARSLGGIMQTARLYVEMPRLAALTFIAVLTGLILDIAFSQLKRITYAWSKTEGNYD